VPGYKRPSSPLLVRDTEPRHGHHCRCRRAPCSARARCHLSMPRASPQTQRACTPACWPGRPVCSPEPKFQRPSPGGHHRARLSVGSPSLVTLSTPPLDHVGPNRATHSSAPLLPSPESECRGSASTTLPPPLVGDITGLATTPNRARVRLIAARCHLLPSSGAPSLAASSPAPSGFLCIGLRLVGFCVLKARVDL
jgi:hypothetical protein